MQNLGDFLLDQVEHVFIVEKSNQVKGTERSCWTQCQITDNHWARKSRFCYINHKGKKCRKSLIFRKSDKIHIFQNSHFFKFTFFFKIHIFSKSIFLFTILKLTFWWSLQKIVAIFEIFKDEFHNTVNQQKMLRNFFVPIKRPIE